jgi:uncharacterized protein with FMN-binding domain
MRRKKIFIIVTTLVIIIIGIIVGLSVYMLNGLSENEGLIIEDVKFSSLADGKYSGAYGSGRWHNSVEVQVNGGLITDIAFRDTVTFERPEITDQLVQSVISNQSTEIDCISGATATCKVYLKSIANALQQPEKE